VFRYNRVPDLSGGNRKSSAIDGSQSNWRRNQPIGSGRTQYPSTRDISIVEVNGPRYRGA